MTLWLSVSQSVHHSSRVVERPFRGDTSFKFKLFFKHPLLDALWAVHWVY